MVSLNLDEALKPNDIIEIDFRITNWVWSQASEIYLIESYCKNREDWEIISNTMPLDNLITFRIKVLSGISKGNVFEQASIAATARTIGYVIATAGIASWLVLLSARKFVAETKDSPGVQAAMSGVGAAGWAILLYVVYKFLY